MRAPPRPPEKKLERRGPPPDAEDDDERGSGRLRWFVGWVLVPGGVLAALFLAGVHVGANYPDLWLSRLITWLSG
jgi:hypothetical protein